MIFPDDSVNELEKCICPICNIKLKTNIFGICNRYYCPSYLFQISLQNKTFYTNHYELIRYSDESIYQQYIIESLRVINQYNMLTIYLLTKNGYDLYFSRELVKRNSCLYLTKYNTKEIMDKLKTYLVFS